MPVVGVMGSGREAHAERAEPLGRWLAELGVHLLTGGGRGVMTSASRAFAEVSPRRGQVIGVLPGAADGSGAPPGYPNPWVEIALHTHLPHSGTRGTRASSRNHLNVLSSDVLVALPGGAGTASEVELALRYGRPIVAFVAERAEIEGVSDRVPVAPDLEAVQAFVRERLGV